ncbi:MAG: potassium channel family protein [Candidatus Promineifilaceae bacterium]
MVKWLERMSRSVAHFLMWDVLRDSRTRPFFIWVGLLILFGTLIFHWLEGWSWVDSLYFCVITLTTVGYGDLTPTTTLTKLLAIFYVLNGVGVLVSFLSIVTDKRRENFAQRMAMQPAGDQESQE